MITTVAHLIQDLFSRLVRMAAVAALSATWGGSAGSPALANRNVTPSDRGDSDELGDETSRLQRALDALPGDPSRALALCNEDATQNPYGPLAPEREILSIEALMELGRAPEARARAKEFAKQYPDALFLPRLREIVGKVPY